MSMTAYLTVLIMMAGIGCTEKILLLQQNSKYLNDSVIATVYASSEHECGIFCSKNPSCKSVNYKKCGTGLGKCELNNRTADESDKTKMEYLLNNEYVYLEIIQTVRYTLFKDIFNLFLKLSTQLLSKDTKLVTESHFQQVW